MPNLDHTADDAHRQTRLSTDVIAWLATTRPDGQPHVVPVWFIWDGTEIVIVSQPGTQKVKNLARNPNVSIALDDTKQGHDVVILEGEATLTSGPPTSPRMQAYLDKYNHLLREMEWSPEAYLAEYTQAIVVKPTRFLTW